MDSAMATVHDGSSIRWTSNIGRRIAWDLLLTDRYSLEEICEKLNEQGFRNCSGKPFIEIRTKKANPNGERIVHDQLLSRVFHNWFYAGWVVVENDWANIKLKTFRGEWEPIVSTDEFERGLAILVQRSHKPMPNKKHFYLLQGLIYLKLDNRHFKLTCGKPNANRKRGGGLITVCQVARLTFFAIRSMLRFQYTSKHLRSARNSCLNYGNATARTSLAVPRTLGVNASLGNASSQTSGQRAKSVAGFY
jgi:hypothetical protein